MQLVWGGISFPVNGCDVTRRIRTTLAPSGRPMRYVSTVFVRAYLDGVGQAGLTAVERSYQAALAVHYQDLVLRQDSGAASAIILTNADSISGVRIIDGPHFPESQGAEYVNRRTMEFTAEAEYAILNAASAVLVFNESIEIVGTGGPVIRHRQAVNARPVRQQVFPYSIVRATQTGFAVGHTVRPAVPLPFAPNFEMVDQRRIAPGSPRRLGQGFIEYPVSWTYVFESPGIPLIGVPSLPPF